MKSKPLVFISSTSDLQDERTTIAASLKSDYEPYLYEEDRARRKSPEDRCQEVIQHSEVFIGIVGEEYGSSYKDTDPRSICEWEFDQARENKDIAIMMLLAKTPEPTAIDPKQKRFRDKVTQFRSGVWCRFFESTQELVILVRKSLTTWLVEYFVQSRENADKRRDWLSHLIAWLGISTVGALALVIGANFIFNFLSPNHTIALCGLTLSVLVLLLLLYFTEVGGKNV